MTEKFKPYIYLGEKESRSFESFKEKHFKSCRSQSSVTITQSGIGLKVDATCPVCHKTKDISDYKSW
jgi:hypothetical protein